MQKLCCLAAVALLGCSAGDGKGAKEVPDALELKLRECKLISEGTVTIPPGISEYQKCGDECFLDADCADLATRICSREKEVDNALTRCLDACKGGELVRCSDGSSSYVTVEVCDGLEACDDGEDEEGCPAGSSFVCKDGEKLPPDVACDGFKNCEDGSDEDDCEGKMFDCGDGQMVRLDAVCNYGAWVQCKNGANLRQDCAAFTCGG